MTRPAGRRVVITGIGAITPIGHGPAELWAGLRRGCSACGPVTRFDPSPFASHIAAEVKDFDPAEYLDGRRARRLDRFSQFAIAASRQALDDAGLCTSTFDGRGVAVYLGSALGGISFGEEQHARFLAKGTHAVAPSLALAVFGGAGATNVAIEFGLHGPAIGNANSCASGAIAVGEAFRLIRQGEVDLALAGGAEAPLAPLTFGAFAIIKALSTHNGDPARASRPFDRARDGFVMSEGAAMLILEERTHALRRGARPYAEIVGYGTTNDAYHMIQPLPSGREAARAIRIALGDAGIARRQVGYLNAHATATRLGDAAEAAAIRCAFGEHASELFVSGTKGLYGHALGASGAIEAALTALVLDRGWLPPSTNLEDPDDGQIRHVPPGGIETEIGFAVSNSFGFGGINASLVFRRTVDE